LENISEKRIPLTRIQKLIGERMTKSKAEKPCFYIEVKADVTELMDMRHELKKTLGVKVTTNAFFIKAIALAAKKYPLAVGRLDGDNIIIADAVNVGFAVNASHGLVVPVVKDADKKSIAEIANLEQLLTEKARSNKLTLEEIEGETIGLSNLGVYGTDSFIGIVPPPASVILAVGNVVKMVLPKEGRPTVCKVVSLTLSADHRIINGTYAADILNHIKNSLQTPQQLV